MRPECGCGRPAEFLIYEDEQPHCEECFRDAVECAVYIMVRKPIDWGNWAHENANKNIVQRRLV